MRGLLVTVMVGSLYAAGYVLVNGLEDVYDLFGLGLKLGGGEALAASLAGAGGGFALWLGIGNVEAPSEDGQSDEAEPRRVEDFQSFVGAPYETSMLDIFWISPTGESWVEGDRRVVCSVVRVDLQRSVGTARALGQ